MSFISECHTASVCEYLFAPTSQTNIFKETDIDFSQIFDDLETLAFGMTI